MGANAQTEVPAFTSGQVLTAAEMTQINTGIPVFATTVTRDAAFGGTGEKVLAEGQYAYIEATNATQFYDGAAWQTVNASGLVVVKNETAFTAATQVVCDNVFSASYTAYKIIMRLTGTTGGGFRLKFRVGGVAASTNYNLQVLTASSTSVTGATQSSQTSFLVANGSNGTFFQSAEILVTGAALAEATTIQTNFQGTDSAYTTPILQFFYGNHSTSTAYDGFELNAASGNFTGVYSVYGLAKTGA